MHVGGCTRARARAGGQKAPRASYTGASSSSARPSPSPVPWPATRVRDTKASAGLWYTEASVASCPRSSSRRAGSIRFESSEMTGRSASTTDLAASGSGQGAQEREEKKKCQRGDAAQLLLLLRLVNIDSLSRGCLSFARLCPAAHRSRAGASR